MLDSNVYVKHQYVDHNDLIALCRDSQWERVRLYLNSPGLPFSNKKEAIMQKDVGTCLHYACSRNAPIDIIKAFITIGGRDILMARGSCGYTALHTACYHFHYTSSLQIISYLVRQGGRELAMAKNMYGWTALHLLIGRFVNAPKAQGISIIRILIDVGGNELLINDTNMGKTAYDIAIEKGLPDDVKFFLTVPTKNNAMAWGNSESMVIEGVLDPFNRVSNNCKRQYESLSMDSNFNISRKRAMFSLNR